MPSLDTETEQDVVQLLDEADENLRQAIRNLTLVSRLVKPYDRYISDQIRLYGIPALEKMVDGGKQGSIPEIIRLLQEG